MKKFIQIIIAIIFFSCNNYNNTEQLEKKGSLKQEANKPSTFDTTQLAKTAEMLDENLYWGIIEKSLKNTNNQDEQQHFLIKEISNLTPKEMIGFRLRTDKLLYDTYNSEMWCAGYIMNGGCSDDGFEYFRNWIISRGKETYYKAKENPDNLITQVNMDVNMYEFESFWYVALDAFKNKTGKDLYNYIDDENFKTKEGNYPQFKFTWQEEKSETMKKICPQLFKTLWHD
jgi:Protein of unknown function (DUF4240)